MVGASIARPKGIIFMKKFYFDNIDSTQVYAKHMAKQGVKNEIFIAKEQNAGIGRNGHSWFSNMGGLYFSYITDKFNKVYTLTLAVAINQVLRETYQIETKIKWPNDILLHNKKIVGIICEKVNNLVVVGIGINTNFNSENLGELSDIATTILSETDIKIDNDELLNEIIQRVDELSDEKEILRAFNENMAFLGEKRYISQINQEAMIMGINDKGYLIVNSNDKENIIVGGTI